MQINGYVEGNITYAEYECIAQFKYWADAVTFAKVVSTANPLWTVRAYSVGHVGTPDVIQWRSDVI